jgi:hypothetical protein
MSSLNFISDKVIYHEFLRVVEAVEKAVKLADKNFDKNTVDPFSAAIEMYSLKLDYDTWRRSEKTRQIQKSLQNAIGAFHQNILGSMPGWINAGSGGSYDVENSKLRVIAEIKNKHNTMNSSSANETYAKLSNHLKFDKKGYTAYLVQVVPDKAEDYNKPWSPSHKTMLLREDIRVVDGESFYDLASGQKDALKSVYLRVLEIMSEDNRLSQSSELALMNLFEKVYK